MAAQQRLEAMQSLYGVLLPQQSQVHAAQLSAAAAAAAAGNPLGPGSMAPPPDKAFSSREELLSFLKNWAASQGYAVVIGRSRTNRLWIRCDRGGEYRDKHANDPSARQRKRKESRLTGCGFSVKASMRKDGIWRSRCECGQHNHGPSDDLREHPSLRRMTDQQLQKVHELTMMGKTPAEIMEELNRLWPDIKVIRRDIYNARKNLKSSRSDGDLSGSASASTSAPTSALPSGTTSLNASFEDPARMTTSSESGRWPWPDDDHHVSKKRRVGPSSRGSDTTATQSFNSVATDGGPSSTQLALDSMSNLPPQVTPPLSEQASHPSPWSRSSMTGQRSSLMSPPNQPSFASQTTDLRAASAASLRNAGSEFTGTATSHLGGAAGGLGHGSGFYSHQIMGPNSSSAYGLPPTPSLSQKHHHDRRSNNQQPQLHPSLRASQVPSPGGALPGMSRRPSHSLPPGSQSNSILQQPQSTSISGSSSSRPNPPSLHISTSDPSGISLPPTAPPIQTQQTQQHQSHTPQQQSGQQPPPPQQKNQSGAVIMQRMQRMEDELREQKGMLNQILSVVQSLSSTGGGGGANADGSIEGSSAMGGGGNRL